MGENLYLGERTELLRSDIGARLPYSVVGEVVRLEGGLRTKGYSVRLHKANKPLITIITVVFNGEEGLEKTILSVINQSYQNIEYIIIDGGSSDNTLNIIRKYESSIDYWLSEKDSGIYDAMNKGLDLASGGWINFMNSGDFIVGDVFKNFNNSPCFLPVYGKNFFGNFRKIKIKDYRIALPNCHQGIIFEKSELRHDLNYKLAADYDYYIRSGYKNNLLMLKCDGYVFFDNTGLSSKNYDQTYREYSLIRKRYFNFFWALILDIYSVLKSCIKKYYRHLYNLRSIILK